MFAHIPGLYVVYPSTAADAKGLLKRPIRDNNPVLFVESQLLYTTKGVVPEGEHLVEIGTAAVRREGDGVTLVSWGPAVWTASRRPRRWPPSTAWRRRSSTCARSCRSISRPS